MLFLIPEMTNGKGSREQHTIVPGLTLLGKLQVGARDHRGLGLTALQPLPGSGALAPHNPELPKDQWFEVFLFSCHFQCIPGLPGTHTRLGVG